MKRESIFSTQNTINGHFDRYAVVELTSVPVYYATNKMRSKDEILFLFHDKKEDKLTLEISDRCDSYVHHPIHNEDLGFIQFEPVKSEHYKIRHHNIKIIVPVVEKGEVREFADKVYRNGHYGGYRFLAVDTKGKLHIWYLGFYGHAASPAVTKTDYPKYHTPNTPLPYTVLGVYEFKRL